MAKYWFARPDHAHASKWAFTPISWKGYAALYWPIILGSITAKVILNRLPQGELGNLGPIMQIAGIALGSYLFWMSASWLLFKARIDWNNHARDYRKGELVNDASGSKGATLL